MKVPKLAVLLGLALLGWWMMNRRESFYNIVPTEVLDPEYVSPNIDPWAYTTQTGHTYARVGDLFGVDINCNNVSIPDLVGWIANNNPHLLHQYVLRFDPSINIYNPNHSPRILKGLLRSYS